MGSMGSTTDELHKCLLLSYTNNRIKSKKFTNENTGLQEDLELPIFSQSLGVFQIDAIFHDTKSGSLGEGEFYIVIIEAIEHPAGLATCALKGDPTGAVPEVGEDGKMTADERDYDVKGRCVRIRTFERK